MRLTAVVLTLLPTGLGQAEILDRTVAVVGAQPILASEVEMQLLLEAMFNDAAPDASEAARKAALDRLVEQRLIETDMTLAGLQAIGERELESTFSKLRGSRFGGLSFEQALQRYRLKERDVREFLKQQLQFTRYVEFRFRAGLQADEEALAAEYRRRYPDAKSAPALETVQDELREQLLAQRAETMLDERVRQLRSETRIVFLDPIQGAEEAAP